MKKFHCIDESAMYGIKYILCDIDDTITTEGKLTAEAYQSLWNLKNAGYSVIPVTGRPAGWCDMIIRQWPVDAVIGENGAFVNYFENNQLKTYTHPLTYPGDIREKLCKIRDEVIKVIPEARISKDQFARVYDLAIDFNEDPPFLGLDTAEEIRKICVGMGAEAKISSIHVNTWYGQYNKLSMTKLFFEEVLNEDKIKERVMYFGDSPNDEPMFEFFPMSCGVANILVFENTLEHMPSYVSTEKSGAGFTEIVSHMLRLKNGDKQR
jgi:HAD superfamily hydrolase (TIGR01484 family)